MPYRGFFLGLAIGLALVGFVLSVIAPMMASKPAQVAILGAALMPAAVPARRALAALKGHDSTLPSPG